ncbi:MAG: hypothetical protein AAF587_37785 [Bacteroidota bacterium]
MKFFFIGVCLSIVLLAMSCSKEKLILTENTPELTPFNPPTNLQVTRTYAMKSEGATIGEMESVRVVDTTKNTLLIKDVAQSWISFNEPFDTQAEETFWFNSDGPKEYEGKFTQVKSGELVFNNFKLEGNTLQFESNNPKESKSYKRTFIKGKDYHTATIYIDPTDRELEPGKEYTRKMLDVSFARTKKLKEKFLRMDTFSLGEHTFDCHVIYIDYGHLHGEVWLAKDELGWFLIYEKATATEGSFELVLDGYERTIIE